MPGSQEPSPEAMEVAKSLHLATDWQGGPDGGTWRRTWDDVRLDIARALDAYALAAPRDAGGGGQCNLCLSRDPALRPFVGASGPCWAPWRDGAVAVAAADLIGACRLWFDVLKDHRAFDHEAAMRLVDTLARALPSPSSSCEPRAVKCPWCGSDVRAFRRRVHSVGGDMESCAHAWHDEPRAGGVEEAPRVGSCSFCVDFNGGTVADYRIHLYARHRYATDVLIDALRSLPSRDGGGAKGASS